MLDNDRPCQVMIGKDREKIEQDRKIDRQKDRQLYLDRQID